MKTIIAPSLLAADFSCLGEEIKKVEQGGADLLHCDIMDGHFVPNISFGIPVIKSIREITGLHLDVHLMINNPQNFITPFAKAGADGLTIHIETTPQPKELLQKIGALGLTRGLTLQPDTPIEKIINYLEDIDRLLIMSVYPGFGGQKFIEATYERLRQVKYLLGKRELEIQVDGGVNIDNAAKIIAAGANNLVAGTAVFCCSNPGQAIAKLKGKA